jgi:hypothetical protein
MGKPTAIFLGGPTTFARRIGSDYDPPLNMTLTFEGFRRLALSLPEATEGSHMGHPDFRVGGKIFATLGAPDADWGMVKLAPDQQEAFVQSEPAVFVPVKNGWGLKGATHVRLEKATRAGVGRAMRVAWENTAPKRLLGTRKK